MNLPLAHSLMSAQPLRVPPPFRAFAVRSDEAQHAWAARAPYGWVHRVTTPFLDASALARLAAEGWSRLRLESSLEVVYAHITWQDLATTAPSVPDLADQIALALALTGVLGDNRAAYRLSVDHRVDYLASRGAGFHNDVARHWSRSLFWLLALALGDVELVMPHASLRLPLAPGDLLVFDQTMAHGLCRPADAGQVLAASFDTGAQRDQLFLTGELLLADEQWAALGAPWLPVEQWQPCAALDLLVAQFDECSGAIQGLRWLRDGMRRSICHVDGGV
jgi:hypothetical protein